jgi:hypothetical protein
VSAATKRLAVSQRAPSFGSGIDSCPPAASSSHGDFQCFDSPIARPTRLRSNQGQSPLANGNLDDDGVRVLAAKPTSPVPVVDRLVTFDLLGLNAASASTTDGRRGARFQPGDRLQVNERSYRGPVSFVVRLIWVVNRQVKRGQGRNDEGRQRAPT